MMMDSQDPLLQLLRTDKRYRLEAYQFVSEALQFAHQVLGLGSEHESEPHATDPPEEVAARERARHLSGQELCEAIRVYALEQYGYMAKCVFNSWGIHRTGDFGEIVFSLIDIGLMRKTKEDRREDFDDVFDFETGLQQSFQIKLPRSSA